MLSNTKSDQNLLDECTPAVRHSASKARVQNPSTLKNGLLSAGIFNHCAPRLALSQVYAFNSFSTSFSADSSVPFTSLANPFNAPFFEPLKLR